LIEKPYVVANYFIRIFDRCFDYLCPLQWRQIVIEKSAVKIAVCWEKIAVNGDVHRDDVRVGTGLGYLNMVWVHRFDLVRHIIVEMEF